MVPHFHKCLCRGPVSKCGRRPAGISGNTTAAGLARIDKDVIARQPHLVEVMFGMNDVARVPLEEARQRAYQFLHQHLKP